MTKRIAVLIRGTGNPKIKDVEIAEGTTGTDLKRSLKVPRSFRIFRKGKNSFLNDDVDLHRLLKVGEKLELSKDAKLGG